MARPVSGSTLPASHLMKLMLPPRAISSSASRSCSSPGSLALHEAEVPLAADEERGGKEVGMGDVEVERHHAAHRLTGGIKSVSIDVVFLADLFKQTDGHLHFVGGAPVVLHGPVGILRRTAQSVYCGTNTNEGCFC